jgi:hypothetical protein
MDGRDMWMIQRRENLSFALEAGETIDTSRDRIPQDLQRNIATELGVTRPIDLAHAAAADQRQDFVRAEASARGESHEGKGRRL